MAFKRVEVTVYVNKSLTPRPGVQVSRLDALKRDTALERVKEEVDSVWREFDVDYVVVDLLTHPGECPFRKDLGSKEFIVAVEGQMVLDSKYKPKAITKAIKRNG